MYRSFRLWVCVTLHGIAMASPEKKPPEKCNISGGLNLVAGTEPEPLTFQVMNGLVLLRRDLLEEAA